MYFFFIIWYPQLLQCKRPSESLFLVYLDKSKNGTKNNFSASFTLSLIKPRFKFSKNWHIKAQVLYSSKVYKLSDKNRYYYIWSFVASDSIVLIGTGKQTFHLGTRMGHSSEWVIHKWVIWVNGSFKQMDHLSELIIHKWVIQVNGSAERGFQVNGSFKQMGHSSEWVICKWLI